jgi:hypothetical protein
MKYTAKYIGKSDYFGSVPVKKDVNGREVTAGTYDKPYVPDAELGLKPIYNTRKGSFGVDLEKFNVNLSSVVPTFGFFDREGMPINNANPEIATDPFFCKNELRFPVKFRGVDFDTNNPIDAFWLSVAYSDERFYFPTHQKRPPTLKNVMFKVIPKEDVGEEVFRDNELDTIYDITRYLMNMDADRKKFVLDAMFEKYPTNASDKQLDKIIIKVLGNNPGKSTFTGETAMDFMDRMRNVDIKQTSVLSIILRARKAMVFHKEKGVYYFKNHALGKSYKEIELTLNREEYLELLTEIDVKATEVLNAKK